MVRWAITLTQNQIQILQGLKPRKFGKPFHGTRHYGFAAHALVRDGLLDDLHGEQATESGQFLTDRGRYLLAAVETDFAKLLRQHVSE